MKPDHYFDRNGSRVADYFGPTVVVVAFLAFLTFVLVRNPVAKKTAIRIPHQSCPHEVDLGYTHTPKCDSEGGLRVTVSGESVRLHLCDHDLILSRDGAKVVGNRLLEAAQYVDEQRAKKKPPSH
jgi:hypothetical protein